MGWLLSVCDHCRSVLVFVAFVVDVAFALCLLGFLVMHVRLVAANCTTIEMYEKRRVPQWPYDRGWRSNFHEVFGYRQVSLIPCAARRKVTANVCSLRSFRGTVTFPKGKTTLGRTLKLDMEYRYINGSTAEQFQAFSHAIHLRDAH